MRSSYLFLSLFATFTACQRTPPPERADNPLQTPPVDSARVRSAEEAASWVYQRSVSADLEGDGQPERLVVAADVEIMPGGSPLWEDGHRWAIYAEAPSGERTLLYGAFVPNGFTEAAVLTPDDMGRRRVLVQERTPLQVRAFEVDYSGPGQARLASGAYYQVEEWLPGAASLR